MYKYHIYPSLRLPLELLQKNDYWFLFVLLCGDVGNENYTGTYLGNGLAQYACLVPLLVLY
jgi:hypothetical protein